MYAGIRKLVECYNADVDVPSASDAAFRPDHGTEITYSHLVVDSEDDVNRLVAGQSVTVRYEE